MAKVTINRTKGFTMNGQPFKVWVDGKEVATIGVDESITIDVQPGKRTLQAGVGINAGISPKKELVISKGQQSVEIGIDPKFYICIGLALLALFGANYIATLITNKGLYFISYIVVIFALAGIMARNTVYVRLTD